MTEFPLCAVCQTPVTEDDRVIFEHGELIHDGCAPEAPLRPFSGGAGAERESAA